YVDALHLPAAPSHRVHQHADAAADVEQTPRPTAPRDHAAALRQPVAPVDPHERARLLRPHHVLLVRLGVVAADLGLVRPRAQVDVAAAAALQERELARQTVRAVPGAHVGARVARAADAAASVLQRTLPG